MYVHLYQEIPPAML